MAAKIVSFINLKGGVGKSTLALVIGEALAFLEPRHRVLLIDIDVQSNLSYATTCQRRLDELESSGRTVYHMFADALQGKAWDIRAAINKTCSNIVGNTHLHNLVCRPVLGELEEDMLAMLERGDKLGVSFREILTRHIDKIRDDYDYIFIDTPPSLGILTLNGLTAAGYVLIPISCEYMALRGLRMLLDTLESVREVTNPNLQILGVLATRYDGRTINSREIYSYLEQFCQREGIRLFPQVIKQSVRFAEAPGYRMPIVRWRQDLDGAKTYWQVAKEVLRAQE